MLASLCFWHTTCIKTTFNKPLFSLASLDFPFTGAMLHQRNFLLGVIFFALLLPIESIVAAGPGVPIQPKEGSAHPGESYAGTIIVTNSTNEAKLVRVSQADLSLSGDGEQTYFASGTLSKSNAAWIQFEPSQLAVHAGSTGEINYSVTVPENISRTGSYWSVLLLKEVSTAWNAREGSDETTTAVQIITHIGKPAGSQLKIGSVDVVRGESATNISVEVENSGTRFLTADIWAEIYAKNGDYVDRFISRSVRLYPGQVASAPIVLQDLRIGKYRAIVAGRYSSPTTFSDVNETSMLVEHVTPFSLSINRKREIVLAQQEKDKPIQAQVFKPTFKERLPVEQLLAGRKPVVAQGKKVDVVEKDATIDSSSSVSWASAVDLLKAGNSQPRTKRYYTVKRGDWLSKIAKTYYGDALKYSIIFAANRNFIKNPDLIYPGQTLVVPYMDSVPEESNEAVARRAQHEGFSLRLQPVTSLAVSLNDDDVSEFGLEVCGSCGEDNYLRTLTRMISVPDSVKSYVISSISVDRIKMPLPLSLRRFSGASGSLTFFGLNPFPSSLIRTVRVFPFGSKLI